MPKYWRDPDDGVVLQNAHDVEPDENDVYVIPAADWERMVELWERLTGTQVLDDCVLNDAEAIEEIIKKVRANNG